jgi:tRNA-specific 2-thiouridylase
VRQTVVVAMSGGVDSSVAAYLLKQQGYNVRGIFMQNWESDPDDETCTIKQDALDVIAVADVLGIDIDIINFAKEYRDNVFAYFLSEYKAYRTPNPDILCNSEIKFKVFLEHAINCGADYIATGHYVAKENINGQSYLLKAKDLTKDQSYFLYRLNQTQVSKSLFPLQHLLKTQVREIAREIALPNAAKKDSTGICFIGKKDFREFLNKYIAYKPGAILCIDTGQKLGTHQGLSYYTIGQRQGIGLSGGPWFVAGKNIEENILLVAKGHDNPLLYQPDLIAKQLSFISSYRPVAGKYSAKIRYRMQDAECVIDYCDDDTMKVSFSTPQFAVTKGQSIVLYDGDTCLGGGIIS